MSKRETKLERRRRDLYYKRTYGISLEQYEQMLESQNHRCALCGRHESEFKNRLAVEHNHKTKKVRSLCCFSCNKFKIGRNNLQTATALYEYMKKYDSLSN